MFFKSATVSPCDRCGALDWTEPSFWDHLRSWLNLGGPWRAAGRHSCRRCGNEILGFGFSTRALAAQTSRVLPASIRVLLAPVWIVAALHRSRTRQPVPRIYLIAALVGVVLGVILQIIVDVRWWLVAIAVIVLVWLLFLASARRNLRNAGEAFLWMTVPSSAMRLMDRASHGALRRTDLPLYGLPSSWSGRRFVGGHRSDGEAVTSWTLAHGDPFDERWPEVRIEVSRMPDHPFELTRRMLFEEFQHTVRRPPPGMTGDEFHQWIDRTHREVRDLPDPGWGAVALTVEGRDVSFFHLVDGEHWMAWALHGDHFVVVRASRISMDEVSLVRVTNVEAYIEGGRIIRERQQGAHEG